MTEQQAIKILKEEKSWESDDRKIDAFIMGIEALEELKEARKGFNENRKAGYKHGYSDGYNKAIDDFVNACKEDILCQSFGLHANGIERIVEQLKAGGKNE